MRWLHAAGDADRAHAAWSEFRDDLADFGLGARLGEPPRTLAGRVSAGLSEPARNAVRRLAAAEERASYADRPCTSQHLPRDGATARRGLASAARRSTRRRARIFPASLLQRLTRWTPPGRALNRTLRRVLNNPAAEEVLRHPALQPLLRQAAAAMGAVVVPDRTAGSITVVAVSIMRPVCLAVGRVRQVTTTYPTTYTCGTT